MKSEGARWKWALGGILAVHVALVLYYAPPSTMFGDHAVATYDYSLHAYQVQRAVEAYRGFGHLWSYDPFVLAGQPAGAVEDLTSKSLELFVIALTSFGVRFAVAYNVYILLVHLLMPPAMYLAARLLDLGRGASTVVVGLAVAMWFFDSFMHWCWFVGMISWAAASYLSVLVVALMYRALQSKRAVHLAALALTASSLALIHPFGVVPVVLPALVMYVRGFREHGVKVHVGLWAAAALAASTTLVWIGPALGFRHYIGEAGVFLRPTFEFLLLDSFDLWKDVLNTGEPVRTLARTLCFVAACVCLWRWRKQRDPRTAPLFLMVVVSLAFAYLGAYSWTARQTQPYRQLGPAMMAAAIPAAVLLSEELTASKLRALSRSAKVALALALVVIVPRAVRNAMHFVPETVPTHVVPEERSELLSVLGDINEDVPPRKGYSGPPADFVKVRDWLAENHRDRGRVLVSNWVLAEYLAGFSGVPILGGLIERNVPHVDAHLFRADLGGDPKGLEKYFDRYAVGFVVLAGEFDPLDYRRDLLDPVVAFGVHRIYRLRREPSYFHEGAGRLESQGLNSIRVSQASGEVVVLRFHWMETLRCRPSCTIERVPVPGDRVGFVGVRTPPAEFEVYNSYEL